VPNLYLLDYDELNPYFKIKLFSQIMGKGIDTEIDEEETKQVGRLQKSNPIKKEAPKTSMEVEGKSLTKKVKKIKENKKPVQVTKKSNKDKYDPEAMKKFEKFYEASVSTKSIITPGMSKGQRRRALKKEKLMKKKVNRYFFS